MKNLLVVSYHFPPVYHAGAKQIAKYCRHLPEFGWHPLVLTKDWEQGFAPEDEGWGLTLDPNGLKELESHVEIFRSPYRTHQNRWIRWHEGLRQRTESSQPLVFRLLLTPLRKVFSFFWPFFGAYPDLFVGWIDPALEVGSRIIQQNQVQAILSICPLQTNHWVASRLTRRFHLPWVACFGDLYGFYIGPGDWHGSGWRRCFARRLNQRCLNPAAKAMAVSPGMVRYLDEMYRVKGEVAVVGFDVADFELESSPGGDTLLRIAHVGSVYLGDEKPEFFFDALDWFLRKNPEAQERVRVLFVGSRCEESLKQMVAGRPVEKVLSLLPKVPAREAIRLQQSSDILLLLNLTSVRVSQGTLSYPSKLFDYFGARRPILAIPGDGDWVDALLRTTRAGRIANTVGEAERILEDWYRTWKARGTIPYEGNPEKMEEYSHRTQAQRLAAALDRAVEARRIGHGLETRVD